MALKTPYKTRSEMKKIIGLVAVGLLTFTNPATSNTNIPKQRANNIVLVHSALVDGSSWRGVYEILRRDGFKVSVVAHTQINLEDDVKATKLILDQQNGPTILVGASYGGTVITEAGNHDNVQALVYVAAMQPDFGETLVSLSKKIPPLSDSLKPNKEGFLTISPVRFHAEFGAELSEADADFLANAQMPLSVKAATTPARIASWHNKPAYGIVALRDRLIDPKLQQFMYSRGHDKIFEVDASHAVFMTQPKRVAEIIEQAANESL